MATTTTIAVTQLTASMQVGCQKDKERKPDLMSIFSVDLAVLTK